MGAGADPVPAASTGAIRLEGGARARAAAERARARARRRAGVTLTVVAAGRAHRGESGTEEMKSEAHIHRGRSASKFCGNSFLPWAFRRRPARLRVSQAKTKEKGKRKKEKGKRKKDVETSQIHAFLPDFDVLSPFAYFLWPLCFCTKANL